MLFDTHMHTTFSTDSHMTLAQAVAKGNELGIGIIITEHMDLDYPQPKAFLFDPDEYIQEYKRFRSDKVLLGIEVGMRPDLMADSRAVAEKQTLDYCIGSIHVIGKQDIYYGDFYDQQTKQDVFHKYFNAMSECVSCYDFIDSLGHIDYICRYARFADPEMYYHEFCEHIDQVLAILATKGKAMEINTRRMDKQTVIENLMPIYKRFYELGGKIVTIGSDAHKPADIGKGMREALELAERCHLKPVWFERHEPKYMK